MYLKLSEAYKVWKKVVNKRLTYMSWYYRVTIYFSHLIVREKQMVRKIHIDDIPKIYYDEVYLEDLEL